MKRNDEKIASIAYKVGQAPSMLGRKGGGRPPRRLAPCTKGHGGSTAVVYAGVTDSGRPYYQCQGCGAVIYG